ncbi:MAG: hypothetical protein JRI23_09635 [Deltaproteobacteria bacterium]|nr:hypothetical protein [Deltaproteobacteria bacterium]MBW2531916.1 hypothetical protein [Deltaproteobacteria bacterium]
MSASSTGDVMACGTYTGAGDFADGFSLPTSEGRDVWVAQYSAAGTLAWARRYGGSGEDGGNSSPARVRCLPLPDGSYVIVAASDGPFDVGGTVVPGSSDSVVIARVASNGDALWTLRTSGPGALVAAAISPADDELAVLLNFDGSTGLVSSFDTAGGTDIYAARISL